MITCSAVHHAQMGAVEEDAPFGVVVERQHDSGAPEPIEAFAPGSDQQADRPIAPMRRAEDRMLLRRHRRHAAEAERAKQRSGPLFEHRPKRRRVAPKRWDVPSRSGR